MNEESKRFKNIMSASILSWLLLMALTFLSVYMVNFISSPPLFISCALIIVFLKGQQIIDIFMELRHAPKRWRLILLSYVVLLPLVIAFIYLF